MPTPQMAFLATNDLVGLSRGRAIPVAELESALCGGVGWTPANIAMPAFGSIVADNLFGARGDLRLLPDPATAVEIPADGDIPARHVVIADQVQLDGQPWQCCPRTTLKDALTALEEIAGLRVVASFEHEFVIDGVPDEPAFSFSRLRSAEPFGSDLVHLLTEAGLEPENWLPEYGDRQYEITLAPTAALAAADRAVLLKEIIRDLARRRGLTTTFAPVLDMNGTGNGVHIHLSLTDLDDEPVLFDPNAAGHLSEIGARFCAGILTHAAAITGWTAPSPVSFVRLAPHKWSVGGIFLGERNREALVRICPTSTLSKTPVQRQFNLEFRAVDATANPWLALAAIVRAGLQGLKDGYPPAHVYPESAGYPDVPGLPGSTADALRALEDDRIAASWFGEDLLTTHLAVRRFDLRTLEQLGETQRCAEAVRVY